MQLTYEVELRRAGITVYAPSMQMHDLRLKARIDWLKLALASYQMLYVAAPPR
ncbi:hypothetical protein GCM10027594_01530 [Hymenobacter agri]